MTERDVRALIKVHTKLKEQHELQLEKCSLGIKEAQINNKYERVEVLRQKEERLSKAIDYQVNKIKMADKYLSEMHCVEGAY